MAAETGPEFALLDAELDVSALLRSYIDFAQDSSITTNTQHTCECIHIMLHVLLIALLDRDIPDGDRQLFAPQSPQAYFGWNN